MREGNQRRHRTGRIGWLRAAVLGANDGMLSTTAISSRGSEFDKILSQSMALARSISDELRTLSYLLH